MKVYVLDSEGSWIDKLPNWLAKNYDMEEISVFKSIDLFMLRIEENSPEIVFIPLGNNHFSGIQLARNIKSLAANINVAFIALDNQYAIDAFEVGAKGYFILPLNKEKVNQFVRMCGK